MAAPGKDKLIVFSRYPQAGSTKTRLIPVLGAEGAAELQRQMTEHTLAGALALAGRQPLAIQVCFEGGDRQRMADWLGAAVNCRAQADGDIGNRMRRALAAAFSEGAARALLIGTDIPGISTDLLQRAFAALAQNDLVLGPAADGGYYLIGMTGRTFGKAQSALFDGIGWGGSQVFSQTLDRAASLGATVARLETLTDVDRPSDLGAWIGRRRQPPALPARSAISVVIPTLNEAGQIAETLAAFGDSPVGELIVVDGGSTDASVEIARAHGATVYRTEASKAGQMNAGAALARGEILLFLHADTRLPPDFAAHIRGIVDQSGVAAGAFRLGIGATGWRLRFIEKTANLRSGFFQMPYGDQAIFMTAETFGAIGGFPNQPIMEDFELIRRLRRRGKIALAAVAVTTSPRRWLNMGIFRAWLINQVIVSAYLAGIPPEWLARWYRRDIGRPPVSDPAAGP